MTPKKSLKEALAKGNTEQVLTELFQITALDTDLHRDVVLLSARFAGYKRQQRLNLVPDSESNIELAKINESIWDIIDKLFESTVTLNNTVDIERIIKIERKSLEIILDGEFNTFDKERFVAVISAFLDIPKSSVRVLQVYQGSIVIHVELPAEYANKLLSLSDEELKNLEKLLSTLGTPTIINISVLVDDRGTPPKKPLLLTKKQPPTSVGLNWVKIAASIAAIITFLGAIAEFSGYSVRDWFSKKDPMFSNVTIMVEDKNGEFVMRQQGKIVMMVEGGDVKQEDIDSKGAASFKNVKIGDKVRLKVDFSEPYRPLSPDSLYTIPKDGRINLRVSLQNLDKVFGRVLFRDKELAGVIVSVGSLRDTTDDLGRYEILIPETDQRQDQEIFFKASGFKSITKTVHPQTNTPVNIVMQR